MTFNTLLLIIYLSSLFISLIACIIVNWKNLHTMYDFIFPFKNASDFYCPFEGEDFIDSVLFIYFPVANSIFVITIMLCGIRRLLAKILKIKIK